MLASRLTRQAWRNRAGALMNIALVTAFALFAYGQAMHVLHAHVYWSVPFTVEYGLLAGLCLVRRNPLVSSGRAWDWIVGAGAWLPLAMRSADTPPALGAVGAGLGFAGAALTVYAMTSLGRSFGIVAASRGLKTGGPYAVVRHPIYAAETIATLGNLAANPSIVNAMIVVAVVALFVPRAVAEERLLLGSTGYLEYKARVQWRFVPGVY